MNVCRACNRQHQNYLCDDCQTILANMLDEIPWLLEELDARIQNLARISTGTIGRTRRPDQLNVMDFDAAEQARTVRKKILDWVEKIAVRHLGRPPATLHYVTTPDLARWLRVNIHHIANDSRAGKLYTDIKRLAGDAQRGGELVTAINPVELHLVGPCPTITGKNRDGTPRQCDTMLFADTYDRTVDCPECQQTIDVRDTRERAAAERDLQTKAGIIEILANIGEPVDEERVNRWIAINRLRCRGWLHNADIIPFQMPDGSGEPLYSVALARRIRRREDNLRTRTRGGART